MSSSLKPTSTSDDYSDAATLTARDTQRVRLTIANASIYYQLGQGPVARYDEPEEFAIPGVYNLERRCDSIRVRSAVAGSPAIVAIAAAAAGEVPG